MNTEVTSLLMEALDVEEDELFEKLLWDGGRFKGVRDETIVDQGRWHTYCEAIVKDTENDTFLELNYKRGSTEHQECELELRVYEVVPEEYTAVRYVRK